MAKRILSTYLGRVYKLANNPREISDGAFTRLVESLMRKDESGKGDIEMLRANPLVVWRVPDELGEGRTDWPWEGQEGKLVMLSGNQRYDVLVEMGYEEIPEKWLAEGKYGDGKWWSAEHAERFILLANSPEGVSGETDYEKLIKKFDEECLRCVGMDFAKAPLEFQERMSESVEDEVEQGEHGEMDQELHDFIKRREDSRGNMEEILDMGFYTVTVFETHDQKMEWLGYLRERYGVEANRDVFINGFAMARALGKEIAYSGLKFPNAKPSKVMQGMAYDGSAEGWETKVGEAPEGSDGTESGEKYDDGSGLDGVM